MKNLLISRRAILVGTIASIYPLGAAESVSARGAADKEELWRSARSENGFPIHSVTKVYEIEGSDRTIELKDDFRVTILVRCIRRFHYEVESLQDVSPTGLADSWSGISAERSNLLSGTAVDLDPGRFAYGVSGHFSKYQVRAIHEILSETDGYIRWGGDLAIPDEGLFYISHGGSSMKIKNMVKEIERVDHSSSSTGPGAGARMANEY